jgi:hypothetical protein
MLVDGQALVKLQELQRDAEANRNIYEQFLSRFKSTNEQRQLQNSQTKIASLAIAPLRPTRPPLPLLLAAIMIASLLTSTAAIAVTRRGLDRARVEKPTPASAPEPKPEVLPKLPVWARIPIAASARSASTVWQTQITATADLDASGPLRPVLERISGLPRPGGKIAFVMSVGKGADGFTIARSLSRSAVSHGILSVVIEVQPDVAGAEVPSREYQGNDVTAADLNAVTELLGPAPQATAPEDDIRSEFGLIVIHASSLALQPDAVSIASYADAVMLVVRADEIESGAMRRVTTALSRFEAVPTGLIVREVALSPANSERDRMGLAV